jgi:hypothetical protein
MLSAIHYFELEGLVRKDLAFVSSANHKISIVLLVGMG